MMPEPDTLPWNGPVPEAFEQVFVDFASIVNHVLALGLQKKVGLMPEHHTGRDGTEKPAFPDSVLKKLALPWFNEHYAGRLHSHYLDSACTFAMARIKDWRISGGNITNVPYQHKPIIFLNNDLWSLVPLGNGRVRLTIKTAPGKTVEWDFAVHHRKFSEWSAGRAGALVILPHGVRVTYSYPGCRIQRNPKTVAFDTNMSRVVFARDDGEHIESDISDLLAIQTNHRKKRESVQVTNARNPAKAERIASRLKGREHHRVEDRLHKRIHGRNSEITPFIEGFHLGREDLRRTTQDTIELDNGRKTRARKSVWIHGLLDRIIAHHHPDNELYYTRGTSRYCPYDNTPLTHPVWKQSCCPTCGRLYDRDWLEADAGLVRTMPPKHRKGQPWKIVRDVLPEEAVRRLQDGSTLQVLHHDEPVPPVPPFEHGLKGLSAAGRSVHPDSRSLFPGAQSDTDQTGNGRVVHGNRSEAFDEVKTVDGRAAVRRRIRRRKSRSNAISMGA